MRALANQERLTFRNAAASFGSSSTSLNSMAKLLFERPLSHRAAFLLRSSITASETLINWKGGAVRESREKIRVVSKKAARSAALCACLDYRHAARSKYAYPRLGLCEVEAEQEQH